MLQVVILKVARGGSFSAIHGLRDTCASCTSNRTTDTRIFSIRGTVSRWFPICLSTSAKEEFSEQHAVRRSQEFPIFPYFSVHDYTGITQAPGQTKLLDGLTKSFDRSLEKRGVGENSRFAPCSLPDLSYLSNFKKRCMTTVSEVYIRYLWRRRHSPQEFC